MSETYYRARITDDKIRVCFDKILVVGQNDGIVRYKRGEKNQIDGEMAQEEFENLWGKTEYEAVFKANNYLKRKEFYPSTWALLYRELLERWLEEHMEQEDAPNIICIVSVNDGWRITEKAFATRELADEYAKKAKKKYNPEWIRIAPMVVEDHIEDCDV